MFLLGGGYSVRDRDHPQQTSESAGTFVSSFQQKDKQ